MNCNTLVILVPARSFPICRAGVQTLLVGWLVSVPKVQERPLLVVIVLMTPLQCSALMKWTEEQGLRLGEGTGAIKKKSFEGLFTEYSYRCHKCIQECHD